MKQETRGGARANAGRKPLQDKKQLLPVYIETSVINKLGGKKEAKLKAQSLLRDIAIALLLLALCFADNIFN